MSNGESYWRVTDQAERLTELTTCDPEIKDRPLRRDVRSLGYLLGQVIREQAGDKTYEDEEILRKIQQRK